MHPMTARYTMHPSQAEQFADDNGYIFSPLDGDDDPDPGEDDPDPGEDDPDPGEDDPDPGEDDPDPGKKDPTKPTNPSKPGGSNSTGTSGTTQTGTGGTSGNRTTTSASRSMGTAQVGSNTPKTGVPFDARYLLCAGVFLTGAYLVISKKKAGGKA